MTRITQNGLTLWYGTGDAPAPRQGETVHGEVAITVAVQPPHPSNRVTIRYRIEDGPVQRLSAILASTDYAGATQYFRALFPALTAGATVQYAPVLMCAGRQTSDATGAESMTASFRYESVPTPKHAPAADTEAPAHDGLFPFHLERLGTVTILLTKKPEIIGETPDGFKVDWYIASGHVTGPKLNAVFRTVGGDWMTIRTDGIGNLDVRTTLETSDGALISMTSSGVTDMGENGFRLFLDGKSPATHPVRAAPRFLTAHANYLWLNRLQCLGVGTVRMDELLVSYDVYAVH